MLKKVAITTAAVALSIGLGLPGRHRAVVHGRRLRAGGIGGLKDLGLLQAAAQEKFGYPSPHHVVSCAPRTPPRSPDAADQVCDVGPATWPAIAGGWS
jgi:hypothetical protein